MPKHSRRWMVIASLCCAALTAAAPTTVLASDGFPSRAIRLIVASSAGSEPDILGRLVALHMGPDLGQPIVVDNKPGAGGLIGVAAVAGAASDGYTIGLVPQATLALSPHLLTRKLFDPLTDITPLGLLSVSGNALMVAANSPLKTYADLVAQAKAQPGKLSFGSWGEGSAGHVSGEIMKKSAGLDMQHVPYKASSEAMMGMLGGEVDAIFGGWGQASTQAKAGKIRVLAVTSPQRAAIFPDAPTFKELGIPFGLNSWYGLIGPRNLPAPVLQRLEDSMQKAARHPDVVARLTALGMQAQSSTAAQLRERLRADHAIWGRQIAETGIQPR
ncbi:tripartite tricarboxylate transporter substrate binding protein [Comamonas humi]